MGWGTYIRHSTLGRIVPDETRSWSRCTCGRNVDHGTALSLFDNTVHEGLTAVEDALDVDLEDALPLFLGDFQRGLFHLAGFFQQLGMFW